MAARAALVRPLLFKQCLTPLFQRRAVSLLRLAKSPRGQLRVPRGTLRAPRALAGGGFRDRLTYLKRLSIKVRRFFKKKLILFVVTFLRLCLTSGSLFICRPGLRSHRRADRRVRTGLEHRNRSFRERKNRSGAIPSVKIF